MGDRGSGRTKGRAGRGSDERRRPPTIPGFQAPQEQPPPSRGVWGRRPGPSSQPSTSGGPSTSYAPSPSSGRALSHGGGSGRGDETPGYSRERSSERRSGVAGAGPPGDPHPGGGGGGDVVAAGRGGLRGRRQIQTGDRGPDISTRPKDQVSKQGSSGKRAMLQANYFKLLTATDWCLYQYAVDFAPEEDRTIARKGLLRLHKERIGPYIFDGSTLYTSRRMPDMEVVAERKSDEAKIHIKIRLVSDVKKVDHYYTQFYNIIMRKCLGLLKMQMVGRDYYDAAAKVEIPQFRLELWPGYLTSIRQHEKNILLCAEISHKVMRQQTLLDILSEMYETNRSSYQVEFRNRVLGTVVLTGYNNNTYRISDVDFETTPRSSFKLKTGESITYVDYYRNKYDIRITNFSQPMLVSQTKPRDRRAGQPDMVYLVPEMCRATGLTDNMRNDFSLMRALSEHTRVSPRTRIDKLHHFNRRLRNEPPVAKELADWNMKLDTNLVDVPGRVLTAEKIVLGNTLINGGNFADWTRDLYINSSFTTVRLQNWVLCCTNRQSREAANFVSYLKSSARGMKNDFNDPRYYEMRDDRPGLYADAIEHVMSKYDPQLIMCIVSNNRADRYVSIKKKCTVDRPVPSQVLLQKNLTGKNSRSIATKVAIQLVCKLGGAPWSVELPTANVMVVGFDVCHDTSNPNRSFGATVASLDQNLTRYYSACNSHFNGQELSDTLSVNIAHAVLKYRTLNKTLPNVIVIYRDGVGEGQLTYVYEHEVEEIKKKLADIYNPQPVKMAFVVVTKRLNTRFFLNGNNPPPGTVIDDVVTNPLKYDFFIISQSVRQGTVSPTGYNVLWDTSGWPPDQMQRYSYKMTHLYYNWSGTVRVPAPCQYAHKLAFLVGQFIHRPPSPHLENMLYFL